MSLKTTIDNDIKKAMLAKNKEELDALRSIKSMILLAETEKGGSNELAIDIENIAARAASHWHELLKNGQVGSGDAGDS